MQLADQIIKEFKENYEKEPLTIRSPGRINLLGEHIDYNDGFVLPAAIDKNIIVALHRSKETYSEIISTDFKSKITFRNDELRKHKEPWVNYIFGVINELEQADFTIPPFRAVFGGDIPIGSGLSSSAALECGFLVGLNELFKLNLQPIEIVKMGQMAEHNFVGTKCGIMDQFANVFGKKDRVIKLDCRSMDFSYHDIDLSDYSILLFDTRVEHSLVSSEYNRRRDQCEEGLSVLVRKHPEIKSLRDCTIDQILQAKNEMNQEVFSRCFYVIKEIERVQKAADAISRNDLLTLGRLMYETHAGLSGEYEVSCPELDALVDRTREIEEVVGSRMMGGGFGGCTLNIVRKGFEPELVEILSDYYLSKFGHAPEPYFVRISDGTARMNNEK